MGRIPVKLDLDRCPHCGVNKPNLTLRSSADSMDHTGGNQRDWGFYVCAHCGGIATVSMRRGHGSIEDIFPASTTVGKEVPEKARSYLKQALDSQHAPAGAIMLTASSVDAMLKDKGYATGSLYERIEKAAADHVITEQMAKWAHQIRLDANDQRHADEDASLPGLDDARQCIEFAQALAVFMFVLPARVSRGIDKARGSS